FVYLQVDIEGRVDAAAGPAVKRPGRHEFLQIPVDQFVTAFRVQVGELLEGHTLRGSLSHRIHSIAARYSDSTSPSSSCLRNRNLLSRRVSRSRSAASRVPVVSSSFRQAAGSGAFSSRASSS